MSPVSSLSVTVMNYPRLRNIQRNEFYLFTTLETKIPKLSWHHTMSCGLVSYGILVRAHVRKWDHMWKMKEVGDGYSWFFYINLSWELAKSYNKTPIPCEAASLMTSHLCLKVYCFNSLWFHTCISCTEPYLLTV